MKVRYQLLIVLTCLCSAVSAQAHGWTSPDHSGWIGPQFSAHFGHEEVEYSAGLEVSYWAQPKFRGQNVFWEPVQIGIDAGVEYNFSRDKWLHYAELQTSIIFGGTSFGLAWDEDYGMGIQWSSWVNWLAGGMIRVRQFRDDASTGEWSLGAYAKGPYFYID